MMAIGSFDGRRHQSPMAEMNMVPLVDVMLVLLVIFIVTAPLLTHSVRIELPRASSHPNETHAERIDLAIRADRTLYWNGEAITAAELETRLAATARATAKPELHILADREARYEGIAQAISAAARAGVTRIAFVTEPAKEAP